MTEPDGGFKYYFYTLINVNNILYIYCYAYHIFKHWD